MNFGNGPTGVALAAAPEAPLDAAGLLRDNAALREELERVRAERDRYRKAWSDASWTPGSYQNGA